MPSFRQCLTAAALLLALPVFADSLPTVKPERVGMSSAKLQVLRQYFQQQVDDGLEPGMQVVVARRGRVVMHENFGYRDAVAREPLSYDTLFRMMSLTKPITNAAAMILYEEGKYSMDDPIAKFLPELANLKVYAGLDDAGELLLEDAQHAPTMHELMTHTAGFTYGGGYNDSPVNAVYQRLKPFEPGIDQQESITRLAQVPLAYQPGTEYMYSYSADILGLVIERMTGMTMEAFLQARIFRPLGMDDTMSWVPPGLQPRLMRYHGRDEDGKLMILPRMPTSTGQDHAAQEPAVFAAGMQLISTTDDYYRFAQMLLNGGEYDGARILSPSTVRFMTTQRYPLGVRERYWAPGQGHGLNVSVVTDPTLINYPVSAGEFSHGGFANGYFFVDPALELIVIFQSQLFPPRYRNDHIPVVNALVHAAIID